MALKVLFEAVHVCHGTVAAIFERVRRDVGRLLGVGDDAKSQPDSGRDLGKTLDFLMKYQVRFCTLHCCSDIACS